MLESVHIITDTSTAPLID